MRSHVLLFIVLITGVVPGQDVPKGVVEGTVVDEVTGEPVRRATVVLSTVSESKAPQTIVVQSQADGRFLFEGLDAGAYDVAAGKIGYVRDSGNGSAVLIPLAVSERKTGVTLKLTPQGIVSGRVFDEDGDPVQDAQIQLHQRKKVAGKLRWQAAAGGSTNDRGEYRIANLMAGQYAVSAIYADPMFQMGNAKQTRPQVYAMTYYPNVIQPGSAQPVNVRKGNETAGIDVRLRREVAFRIRVRVEGVGAELMNQTHVILLPRESSEGFGRSVGGSRHVEPGVFELAGARAGSWYVQARVPQQGGETLIGMTPIEVTTEDLSDVVVRVMPGQQIHGTFAFEGTPAVTMNWKNYRVGLGTAEGRSYSSGSPRVTEGGAFVLVNNMPAKYLIEVHGPQPEKTYLASIKVGNEEYLGRELDLTGGAPGPIKIIYRNDAAAVSGKFEGEVDAAPGKPGMAVLVPVEAHLRRLEYMAVAPIKPDGSFAFPQVRPGEYLVCHMVGGHEVLAEEGEPPKESMDAAVRLKVEPNGTHTVQLKAVRAAPQP